MILFHSFDYNTGNLLVRVRAARTGVQIYARSEVSDSDDPRPVGVNRPESEVFAKRYLDSFEGIPVTYLHPSELVKDTNRKYLEKGYVASKGYRDPQNPDHVCCDAVITDKDLIKKIIDGTHEVSVGYTAVYRKVTGDGFEYQQEDLYCNHLAVVPKGRAGSARLIIEGMKKAP